MYKMNSNIKIVRGDTFNFVLTIDDELSDSAHYILQETDRVYLGVTLPHQPFEDAFIRKVFTYKDCDTAGNIIINFTSEDTVDVEPGVYYYTIKLRKNATDKSLEEVSTIINRAKFIVLA